MGPYYSPGQTVPTSALWRKRASPRNQEGKGEKLEENDYMDEVLYNIVRIQDFPHLEKKKKKERRDPSQSGSDTPNNWRGRDDCQKGVPDPTSIILPGHRIYYGRVKGGGTQQTNKKKKQTRRGMRIPLASVRTLYQK